MLLMSIFPSLSDACLGRNERFFVFFSVGSNGRCEASGFAGTAADSFGLPSDRDPDRFRLIFGGGFSPKMTLRGPMTTFRSSFQLTDGDAWTREDLRRRPSFTPRSADCD